MFIEFCFGYCILERVILRFFGRASTAAKIVCVYPSGPNPRGHYCWVWEGLDWRSGREQID